MQRSRARKRPYQVVALRHREDVLQREQVVRPGPHTLAELCGWSEAAWRVTLVQPEVGGGKTSIEEIAAALGKQPNATSLTVSGLDQTGFEAFAGRYAKHLTSLNFWKCPRIADLSLLEQLPQLTHVAFYWNQRATRLWDFARTPNLRALQFQDFSRLHDLQDLSAASSLRELRFGDAMWAKSTFQSLEPIAALGQLEQLSLDAKRIEDGRVQPLAKLAQLKTLEFPTNMFTTQQVAWLRARLPASVQCPSLAALRAVEGIPVSQTKRLDRVVIGKRKPFLSSEVDSERLQRYEADFQRMLEAFRADPSAEPDE